MPVRFLICAALCLTVCDTVVSIKTVCLQHLLAQDMCVPCLSWLTAHLRAVGADVRQVVVASCKVCRLASDRVVGEEAQAFGLIESLCCKKRVTDVRCQACTSAVGTVLQDPAYIVDGPVVGYTLSTLLLRHSVGSGLIVLVASVAVVNFVRIGQGMQCVDLQHAMQRMLALRQGRTHVTHSQHSVCCCMGNAAAAERKAGWGTHCSF